MTRRIVTSGTKTTATPTQTVNTPKATTVVVPVEVFKDVNSEDDALVVRTVEGGAKALSLEPTFKATALAGGGGGSVTPSNIAPPELSDSVGDVGTSALYMRGDAVVPHGNRGGGALHGVATTSVAGFMAAADKVQLDDHETRIDRLELPVAAFTTGTPTLTLNATNRLSGTVTAATLPLGVTVGDRVVVELVGLGDIVVTRSGAQLINGATTKTLPGAIDPARTVAEFIYDASNAWTIGDVRTLPTFDALVGEAIVITHSAQAVGMAGKTDTWTGQQGAAGFNGGGFKYTVGAAGDSTHTPGTFEVDVGAENGSSTAGSFKISSAAVSRFLLQVVATVVYITSSAINWTVTGQLNLLPTTTMTLAAGTYMYQRAAYWYFQTTGAVLFREIAPPPVVAAITSATTTTVQTLGLVNGSSNFVEFICVVSDNTAHKSQTFRVTATVRVLSNLATIVSSIDSSPADTDTVGCTFTLDTSTTNVRGRLTTPGTNNITVQCTAYNHTRTLV